MAMRALMLAGLLLGCATPCDPVTGGPWRLQGLGDSGRLVSVDVRGHHDCISEARRLGLGAWTCGPACRR